MAGVVCEPVRNSRSVRSSQLGLRGRLAVLLLGTGSFLFVGCFPATVTRQQEPTPTYAPLPASPALERLVDRGSFDVSAPFPVTRPVNPAYRCGLERDNYKVALRLDPPLLVAPDTWRFSGCVSSPGNRFFRPTVVLRSADGTLEHARQIAPEIDGNSEFLFEFNYKRGEVAGLLVSLYWRMTPR